MRNVVTDAPPLPPAEPPSMLGAVIDATQQPPGGRNLPGLKQSLSDMLSDPRTNAEIAADLAAQRAKAVADLAARLPRGFRIDQRDNEWALVDPAGDTVASVFGSRPPSDEALTDWEGTAADLARTVDYSDALREGDGTPESPVIPQQPSDVAAAGAVTEDPTPGQAEAGNYRKGRVKIGPLDITIETPEGGERTGLDGDGKPWSTIMPAAYGYVRRTKGADGDQVDVFLGPDSHNAKQGPVFVVDQIDPATGQFDEHKALLGYPSEEAARAAYEASFSDGSGRSRIGAISTMTFRQFSMWARNGNTTDALKYQQQITAPISEPTAVISEPPAVISEMSAVISEPSATIPELVSQADELEAQLAAAAAPGAPDAWEEAQTIAQPRQEEPTDAGQSGQRPAAATGDDTRPSAEAAGPGEAPADAGDQTTEPPAGTEASSPPDGEPAGGAGGVVADEPREEPAQAPASVQPPEPADDQTGRDTEPSAASPSPDAAGTEVAAGIGRREEDGEDGADVAAPSAQAEEPDNVGPAILGESAEPLDEVAAEDGGRPAEAGPAGSGGATGEPDRGGTGGAADEGGDAKVRGGRNRAARRNPSSAGGVGKKRGKAGRPGATPDRPASAEPEAAPSPAEDDVPPAPEPINIPRSDFTITDDLELGRGSEGEKYGDNVAAIRTLKAIEAENRAATADEQRILARYVGWGGLKNAFRVAGAKPGEGVAKGWEKRVAELEELLTPAELRAARASTKAAHYTSQAVVEGIWRAVDHLGFAGGAVLEPSVGTGNFIGLMPPELRGQSDVLAVEYDSLTARIAQMLYPNQTILHSGLQNVPLPKNQFALAIGNPPFGSESLYFRHNPAINGKTIHNQFFLSSLDSVAEGGLVAMVVSHFLMDALDGTNRLAMAEKGEFIGAIRLPDTAFKENARTEVVTDVIFFRKRSADDQDLARKAGAALSGGKDPEDAPARYKEIKREIEGWTRAAETPDPAGTDQRINVNGYFLRHPQMVVGEINATGTMYGSGASLNVTLDDPTKFRSLFDAAVARLPKGRPMHDVAEASRDQFALMAEAMRLAVDQVEVGAITLKGGLHTVVSVDAGDRGKSLLREIPLTETTPFAPDYSYTIDGKWQRTEDVLTPDGKPVKVLDENGKPTNRNTKRTVTFDSEKDIPARHQWGKARIAAVTDMLPIKDLLKKQLVLETQDASQRMLDTNRKKLNEAYDAFVKKHGQLHDAANEKIALTMPDGGLILSVEENTGTKKAPVYSKAAIMSRRVSAPPQPADKADNASDAVAIVLGELGRIDIPRVAELLGTDQEGAEKALSEGDAPRAFYDPEGERWEPADAYLSGLVRRKLVKAQEAGLEANVKALTAVIPQDWTAAQITPNIGSAWIPGDVYADFLKHMGFDTAAVAYSEATNTFSVVAQGKAKLQWATSGRSWSPSEIVTRLLNSQSMRVTYVDSDDKTVVDETATAESTQKASEIFNEFLDWVYRDDDRRVRLVALFNEKFNTRVPRQRDGSHLTLPGKVPDQVIKLRRHQVNAVWRGITDPAVLYDHVVGAGKTFVAIARIMERRRMGLSRKPLVVVPKHLVEQWAADVATLYPGAKVLTAGEADFKRQNRRRLFAKIASGDYDMTIIGHSSFGFIDLDQGTEERFLMDELEAALAAVKEAEEVAREEGFSGFGKPFGVAEAERLVTKIENRLAKLRTGKRDRLLTFEEMGIDDLTVDEAHEFKNLAYSSRLTGVSGMGNKTGSNKAMDLHLKLRSLRERPGSSVAFLTGTPISNSVAEMYLILRNLAPDELKAMGILNFDAWRSMFVSYASAWEPTEAGGMKEVTRLGREWMNMKALMDLYYAITDAVTLEDLKTAHAEDYPGQKFPVPDVVSQRRGEGDRKQVTVKPSREQRAILADLVAGFEGLRNIKDPKERNKTRLRLMDRGLKVALDARAVDPALTQEDGTGKIGAVVDNVVRIYQDWNDDKGTQIVFLDRSVPTSKGDDKLVKAYDDLRAELDQAIAAEDEKKQAALADRLALINVNEIEALRDALRGGWNGYKEIKRQLIAKGIPENEIAFIQDADGDAKKAALFDEVRAGRVRVLIGSTPRLGAGTNVQERLVGLHHVDVTWKPSDIEQREGRIIRQGNALLEKYGDKFAVEIIAYATEMTTDAKMWSLNSSKLKAINGIRKYDGSFMMEFEDEEAASMAEMAAHATGNPLMVERVTIAGDIQKLEIQQRAFNNTANALRDEIVQAKRTLETGPGQVEAYTKFETQVFEGRAAAREDTAKRSITVAGKKYTDRVLAREAIDAAIAKVRGDDPKARYSIEVGGEKVTSDDQITAALREKLGTADFVATVDGVRFIDMFETAKAVAKKVNPVSTEKATTTGIEINGVPVEIDAQVFTFGGKVEIHTNFAALSPDDRTMADYWSRAQPDINGGLSVPAVRGGLEAVLDRMNKADYLGAAKATEERMAAARKALPGLEEQAGKPWPKLEELQAKRARQAELTELLAGSSFATALQADGDAPAMLTGWASVDRLPFEALTDEAEAATVEAVRSIVGPRGAVEMMAAPGRRTQGGEDVRGAAIGGLVRVAATGEPAAFQWALHHEAIHALRNLGLFAPGEWASLEAAVKAGNWIDRFDLRTRYPGLSEARLIEEAVAEAFAARSVGDDNAPRGGVLTRAWAKTGRFLEALRNGLAGRGLNTAEGIFERTAAGDVGGRGDPLMDVRGPQDIEAARRAADAWEDTLTVPVGPNGERVDLMAGMSPELKRLVETGVRRGRDGFNAMADKLWRGSALPDGVVEDVLAKTARRDLSPVSRWMKTPERLFRGTDLEPVIWAGIKAEEDQSKWITRLVNEYDQIRKTLADAKGDFDKVTEALWAGDADQVDINDRDALTDLLDGFDLNPAERAAFSAIHTLLEKQARLVDNHRRSMMPKWREEKERLLATIRRLMDHAKVDGVEADRLYRRRAALTARISSGRSKDLAADAAQIEAINVRLGELRGADPDIAAKIAEIQGAVDAVEAKLNASAVRGRIKGYVPHKFYGSWRLWELLEPDPETGEERKREITSDQGFFNTREDAIRAAAAFLADNPGASLRIGPKQIHWPVGIEGTVVSDAAFGQLARNLAAKAGLEGDELRDVLTNVARKRNRRRVLGPGMFRSGAEGYSRQMDRIMRTHIGQTVRYVTMDKLKWLAITTAEASGLSPYRIATQERPELQKAFEAWFRDVNGNKQGLEEEMDAWLRRFPIPVPTLAAGLVGYAIGSGLHSPMIGAAAAGFLGYQTWKTLSGRVLPWRAPEHHTDFPTRTLASNLTTAMAHAKLGLGINLKSALVNLTQTVINTLPEIGFKYTGIGIVRAGAAFWASARGNETPDTRLMTRAGVQSLYRISEAGPVLAEHESKLAKLSMWAFQSAENINRAVAFLGGYQRALDLGHSPGDAFREAQAVVRSTQFHMGAANKPEILRQQWTRLPGQFKNFMFQQIARMFSLSRKQVMGTVAALAVFGGAFALPGFQIVNAFVKLASGWSPQDAIERVVLETNATSGFAANAATVFAKGLPALYTDISQSVGMGAGFLPMSINDFKGPWWSSIEQQAQAAVKSAGLVDRLALLSPSFNALKALEAAADGRQITSAGFYDPEVWGNDKAVWTDWRRKGAVLYEPNTGQLIAKSLNFTPAGESSLRSMRHQSQLLRAEWAEKQQAYLADIIRARREKRYDDVSKIVQQSRADGFPLTPTQIREAVKNAERDAIERTIRDTPRQQRQRVQEWGAGVRERLGQGAP